MYTFAAKMVDLLYMYINIYVRQYYFLKVAKTDQIILYTLQNRLFWMFKLRGVWLLLASNIQTLGTEKQFLGHRV
jgi:hypothetical protein